MQRIFIPEVNPVKFYRDGFQNPVDYNFKHLDDFEHFKTIPEWNEQVDYLQPWQRSETVYLHLQTTYNPLSLDVIDERGVKVFTQLFAQLFQNVNDPALWIVECALDLSDIPEGVYRFQITTGSGLVLKTNRMDVCDSHPHTVLLTYRHFAYHQGVAFETGITFQYRVEGRLLLRPPASKDILFEDQPLNETLISSKPYRLWQFVIGDAAGIPDYVIDKQNRIWACSDVTADGRYYCKADGAKFEERTEDGYPLRGFTIDLREQQNRGVQYYEDATALNGGVQIIVSVDSKGFGPSSGGGTHQILDVQ